MSVTQVFHSDRPDLLASIESLGGISADDLINVREAIRIVKDKNDLLKKHVESLESTTARTELNLELLQSVCNKVKDPACVALRRLLSTSRTEVRTLQATPHDANDRANRVEQRGQQTQQQRTVKNSRISRISYTKLMRRHIDMKNVQFPLQSHLQSMNAPFKLLNSR